MQAGKIGQEGLAPAVPLKPELPRGYSRPGGKDKSLQRVSVRPLILCLFPFQPRQHPAAEGGQPLSPAGFVPARLRYLHHPELRHAIFLLGVGDKGEHRQAVRIVQAGFELPPPHKQRILSAPDFPFMSLHAAGRKGKPYLAHRSAEGRAEGPHVVPAAGKDSCTCRTPSSGWATARVPSGRRQGGFLIGR